MRSSLVVLAVTGVLVSAAPVPIDFGEIASELAGGISGIVGKGEGMLNFEGRTKEEKLEKQLVQKARLNTLLAQARDPSIASSSLIPGDDGTTRTGLPQSQQATEEEAQSQAIADRNAQTRAERYQRATSLSQDLSVGRNQVGAGFADSQRGNPFTLAGGRGGDTASLSANSALSSWRNQDAGRGGSSAAVDPTTAGFGNPATLSPDALPRSSADQFAGVNPLTGAGSQYRDTSDGQIPSALRRQLENVISSNPNGGAAGAVPRRSSRTGLA